MQRAKGNLCACHFGHAYHRCVFYVLFYGCGESFPGAKAAGECSFSLKASQLDIHSRTCLHDGTETTVLCSRIALLSVCENSYHGVLQNIICPQAVKLDAAPLSFSISLLLIFMNLASYIQDGRKITLKMPHFIFIQQISVLNILNMLHNLHFFSSKCRLFHNATLFGFCITHILNTGCAKI